LNDACFVKQSIYTGWINQTKVLSGLEDSLFLPGTTWAYSDYFTLLYELRRTPTLLKSETHLTDCYSSADAHD